MKLQLLDLFSGIGGFSLGLEATGGFETVAFCEIDPYARAVLGTHWPGVPIYDDVRALTGDALRRDGIAVDAICGGFPCQDLSFAGRRAGLEGARSGLWSEYARLIGELRPRVVIVENVPGLLSLGMGRVLGYLSALGYDAVWDCVPASAVGAPHRRDRVWVVAHTDHPRLEGRDSGELRERAGERAARSSSAHVADAEGERRGETRGLRRNEPEERTGGGGETLADPTRQLRHGQRTVSEQAGRREFADGSWWVSESGIRRVAHGVPRRVDRLRCLGNAVVPQIPYLLGKAVLEGLRQ